MLRPMSMVFVCTATLGAQPLPSRPLDDGARAQLVARAHVLTASDPAAPLDDLQPLSAMLGDVRVLAVGESSHGSHEQQQWRHRLLRLFVERHRCDTVVLECSTQRAQALDTFVHGGDGEAAALRQLDFWPLETVEMAATLQWLRGWNADPAHQRKVSVFGMDPQQCEPPPDESAPLGPLLAAQAKVAARMAAADMATSWNLRDEAMAAAVAAIALLQGESARVFVGAHATHLRSAIEGALDPCGRHLRARFGDQLCVVSLCFDSGSFLAYDLPEGPSDSKAALDELARASRGIVPFAVPSLRTGLAAQLHELDRSPCLYDLRRPDAELARWCRRSSRIRIVGGGFRAQWSLTSEPCRPAELGDAVLFEHASTPATRLPPTDK